MAVPPGLSVELAAFLQQLETRVSQIEGPQGFVAAYLTTSKALTTANAAQAGARWAILTDLHTAAYSDGVHWRRIDSGALIV